MYTSPPHPPKRASFLAVLNFSYQIQAYQPSITPYKLVSKKNGKIGKLVLHLYIPRQENHQSLFKGRGDRDFILCYM